MKRCIIVSLLAILFLSTTSCGDNDDPKPVVNPDENEINSWIYDTLFQHYLWYNDIPKKESLNLGADPEDFFNSLLSDKDGVTLITGQKVVFSMIEKKQEKTKSVVDNQPSYGFEYMLYSIGGANTLIAQVLYVLPNSPAEDAGLKRGDLIVGIGEEDKSISTPEVLDSGDGIILHIARFDETGGPNHAGTLNLEAARVVQNNPFVKDTVIDYGGHKVGYLAYTHFDSGPNGTDDKTYDNQMKDLFAKFKSQKIDDFVLDLRYNGGGLVSSALLMASLLAPENILENSVFCHMEYNDKNPGSNRDLKFDSSSSVKAANLNLKKLYVLTGMQTASSSEAIINTLIPYIGKENIILIGEKTVGKTVGSNPYGEKDNYGYILRPITFRMTNSAGNADYAKGFDPDIYYDEFTWGVLLRELGDPKEELLKRALAYIVGEITPRSEESITIDKRYKPVYFSLDNKKPRGMINDLD